MLNDIRLVKNISRDARDFLAKRKSADFTAIVLGSSVHNILAKMYFNFSKPLTKTTVFSDVDKAKEWLLKEIEKIT